MENSTLDLEPCYCTHNDQQLQQDRTSAKDIIVEEKRTSKDVQVCWEYYTPTPPDGGWGWVIVFSSFSLNLLVIGIAQTYGLFLEEYTKYFRTGVGSVSFANSLLIGILQMIGPVVSALVNKWGFRPVGFLGSIVAAAAFILSTLSPTVLVFQITYGIVGGFGFGMMYLPAVTAVGHYFGRRRVLANGIAQCGGGMGMLCVAPLARYLLNSVGWKGAHYIFAGLLLQGCVFSALMRPLTARRRTTPKSDDIDRAHNSCFTEDDNLLPSVKLTSTADERSSSTHTSLSSSVKSGSSKSIQKLGGEISKAETQPRRLPCLRVLPKPLADILADILDLEVLKNKSMIILCIGNFLAIIAYYVPVMFVADRAIKLGVSKERAALLVSLMGLLGTVGRVIPGVAILVIPKLTALMWNNGCLLIAGISLLLTPRCYSYTTIILAAAGGSTTSVAYQSLAPVIICDLIGLQKLNSGFGLVSLVRGISAIIGPPLAGMLYDLTGSYDATFYMGTAFYFTSLTCHSLLFCKVFQAPIPEK